VDQATHRLDAIRDAPDMFPKLLLDHARVRPSRPANREKAIALWDRYRLDTAPAALRSRRGARTPAVILAPRP
jgi:hypothetical protein